jgi:outer membrane protein OmpA-like peptidoglycan-associated protein
MRPLNAALCLAAAALLGACGATPRRDLEFDRLQASLQALATDPQLARLALAERAMAEAAVRRLDASSVNAAEHALLAYLAERRVDIAYIAAQAEQEAARLAELQREHAGLLLAASRREAAAMREELDRQRQRELLQQEDWQRRGVETPPPRATEPVASASAAPAVASAPAAPSAPQPAIPTPVPPPPTPPPAAPPPATAAVPAADLPPASSSVALPPAQPLDAPAAPAPAVAPAMPGLTPLAQRLAALAPEQAGAATQMTLEDLAFEPGTATLVPDAAVGIARLAAFVNAEPARPIRIAGHTDATGSPDANQALSLRRAEAVRDALVAAGVAAPRIAVAGEGAAEPVASNDDAQGRARNRRVVVQLSPPQG